jgi:predicted nucleic acid-binding protein
LGDALIAATALVHDLTPIKKTEDYHWIENLKLLDPITDR